MTRIMKNNYSPNTKKKSIRKHPICLFCKQWFTQKRDVMFLFKNKNKQDYSIENIIPIHRDCYQTITLSQRNKKMGDTT
jgi:hypothetical protein